MSFRPGRKQRRDDNACRPPRCDRHAERRRLLAFQFWCRASATGARWNRPPHTPTRDRPCPKQSLRRGYRWSDFAPPVATSPPMAPTTNEPPRLESWGRWRTVGSRRHAGKATGTTVSSKQCARLAPDDWTMADEKMCGRLQSVDAALPTRQRLLEIETTQPRAAIAHPVERRFVQDENSAPPFPRGATRDGTLPVPANSPRRDTRPAPASPRANTKFQPRHRNARDRLADKLHAALPPARAAASEWQR